MVTGELPFDAESDFLIQHSHLQEPPRSPRSINPGVPAALEAVILRALEKDPQKPLSDM